MRAIDMHYNKNIIGGKLSDYLKMEMEDDAISSKEEVINFLSKNGCPDCMDSCFIDNCSPSDGNCKKCWEQKPYEYKKWEEE